MYGRMPGGIVRECSCKDECGLFCLDECGATINQKLFVVRTPNLVEQLSLLMKMLF